MADFVRRSELWTYDVFPKVIGTEKESTIHIRPFGGDNFFPAGSVHEAAITWLISNTPRRPLSEKNSM